MIVVDASTIVDALLHTPGADAIRARLFDENETLHAPHLLDLEVAQVLRRFRAIGDIDDATGARAIADLISFPIQRYPHTRLIGRIWALRNNLTAYDAAYVALAEVLDAPLLTRDCRLAEAPGHDARVELI